MNAGAFGGETRQGRHVVHGVTEAGEAIALTKDDVKFAYRRTDLPPHFIITRVDFELPAAIATVDGASRGASRPSGHRVSRATRRMRDRSSRIRRGTSRASCSKSGGLKDTARRRGVFGSARKLYRESWPALRPLKCAR